MEIYRAQYHRLPFWNIPKVIIGYLAFEVVRNLNYFLVNKPLTVKVKDDMDATMN